VDSDAGRWRDLARDGRLPRFALLCLGIWLNAADSLVTSTIMPSVAADIGGYEFFAWPVAAYLLGAIVAGASAGRLTEIVGLRAALFGAALVYAGGCVAGALAPGMAAFLAGRLLQGAGAGWIVGLVYGAVNAGFPKALWTRVLAAVSGVWGVATLLGPLLGGLFAEPDCGACCSGSSQARPSRSPVPRCCWCRGRAPGTFRANCPWPVWCS